MNLISVHEDKKSVLRAANSVTISDTKTELHSCLTNAKSSCIYAHPPQFFFLSYLINNDLGHHQQLREREKKRPAAAIDNFFKQLPFKYRRMGPIAFGQIICDLQIPALLYRKKNLARNARHQKWKWTRPLQDLSPSSP